MQACRHGHSMSRFDMDDAATRVGIVAAQGLERYMTASHEVSAVRRPAGRGGRAVTLAGAVDASLDHRKMQRNTQLTRRMHGACCVVWASASTDPRGFIDDPCIKS